MTANDDAAPAAPITAWPTSAELWQRAHRTLAGGVSTGMRASMKPHPLYFTHGQGSRLWDVDGHSYLDYVLGWGPVILGHADPGVTEAIARQAGLGLTYGACHRGEFEVAERVVAAIPGMERVLWSNTGTEAVQVALRLVRAATGRRRYVKFAGHYHGWSDPMLVGYRPGVDGRLGLGSRGQDPGVTDEVELLSWNAVDQLATALRDPANDIAAVFCEPVLCNSGVLAPAAGFLEAMRSLCDETGTLLVFDEVITGFRLAPGGAVERYGVVPDLVILAKAIANGAPLSAVAGRGDLIDLTQQGVVHAGTYNGNPISLAAAAATLDALGRPGVHDQMERLAGRLVAGMRAAFVAAGVPGDAHHVGPVVQCTPGVESLPDLDAFLAADWAAFDRLAVALLRRGVFVLPGGRWYLSAAHTQTDIDKTVAAFHDALAEVTAAPHTAQ